MATFTPQPEALNRALEIALAGTTQYLQAKITPITPRDPSRLPQAIDRKDGKRPIRSTYYWTVSIGGHWYAGISGKLKQSVTHEPVGQFEQKIGVSVGTSNVYAKFLEFGTRKMRPRSFLRKGIIDNQAGALDTFQKLFSSALW